jgi:hypothetical protein
MQERNQQDSHKIKKKTGAVRANDQKFSTFFFITRKEFLPSYFFNDFHFVLPG